MKEAVFLWTKGGVLEFDMFYRARNSFQKGDYVIDTRSKSTHCYQIIPVNNKGEDYTAVDMVDIPKEFLTTLLIMGVV